MKVMVDGKWIKFKRVRIEVDEEGIEGVSNILTVSGKVLVYVFDTS